MWIFPEKYGMMSRNWHEYIRKSSVKGQVMYGSIQIYHGAGRGKTTAALGLGIRACGEGKQVIMVQFLKGKNSGMLEFLKKLEPDLKIFRFEREGCRFSELSPEKQKEQIANIKTALAYTRKVMDTGECDVLILDEIFGLIDYGIITDSDLLELLQIGDYPMDIILTGRNMPACMMAVAIVSITSPQKKKEAARF
jgi:cob(I)alamin adenosyltransferase